MIVPFNRRNPIFWIGEIVYLVVQDEPSRGIITGVDFREANELFEVSWGGGGVTFHAGYELTREFVPNYKPNED